ncbi:MAG: hypothetical protein HQK76_17945 [Desulfobacterales bacterium]|nr:hypothetical protein [Desulfobacterales bacterium]
MGKLRELKDLIQEAIDNGATTVEQIHKDIANKPFEVLERINISGEKIQKIQELQDKTIGNVYELIRTLNQKIGEIASDLLAKIEKEDDKKE